MLLLFLFLILPFSTNSTHLLKFSAKSTSNERFQKVSILNKNWETIGKFVNFGGNSSKINNLFVIRQVLDKVILQVDPHFGQNEVIVSLNPEPSAISFKTNDYNMKIVAFEQEVKEETIHKNGDNGCACVHGNCACCLGISIPEFEHSVCVNATYNPVSIGLDLSIGVDGHYFSEEISIRNPPPICFSLPIPGAEHIAGLCVAFSDLDIDKQANILSGCVDLEIELIHLRVVNVKIGCFRMPI